MLPWQPHLAPPSHLCTGLGKFSPCATTYLLPPTRPQSCLPFYISSITSLRPYLPPGIAKYKSDTVRFQRTCLQFYLQRWVLISDVAFHLGLRNLYLDTSNISSVPLLSILSRCWVLFSFQRCRELGLRRLNLDTSRVATVTHLLPPSHLAPLFRPVAN